MHQQQTACDNIVGKGEIARNEQFLLFPQRFLFNQIIVSPFVHIFDIISLFAAESEEPEIGISGKGFSFLVYSNQMLPLIDARLHIYYGVYKMHSVFRTAFKEITVVVSALKQGQIPQNFYAQYHIIHLLL